MAAAAAVEDEFEIDRQTSSPSSSFSNGFSLVQWGWKGKRWMVVLWERALRDKQCTRGKRTNEADDVSPGGNKKRDTSNNTVQTDRTRPDDGGD